jgi:hypothetical protein
LLARISVDTREEKLTVVGDVDPVCVIFKLRKKWRIVYLEFVADLALVPATD